MQISEQWLREWVNPPVLSAELATQLTMAGLEVDSLTPAAPMFDHVVVGRVVELIQHPNADRLRVVTVDVGGDAPLQIVCGAPNVAIGMYVPTAVISAVLPGGFAIKKSKLRGVESFGMLCSAKELGLAETSEGLLPLPCTAIPGQSVRDLLQLDDMIFTVELTPNRGDCLSLAGIAREVAAINRCALQSVSTEAVPATIDDIFPIAVSNPADCPRYVGRVVRGVNPAAATPLWMTERLRRAGLRSLGPLVDVTNYVMLELGQPMHAFDRQQLQGGIIVRRAQKDESITLLNGAVITLDQDTLLIADEQGPLAMAGVMGGAGSACSETTTDVFLESAFFAPKRMAGRARRYGLQTDSSYRFERGVDHALPRQAIERATSLLIDIAGGQPGPVTECVAPECLPIVPIIPLRQERVRALLGFEIAATEIVDILSRLGMSLESTGSTWHVTPPTHRFDIAVEADVIEEIIRIHGYHHLPSHHPATTVHTVPLPETTVPQERFRDVLIDRGFQEAITYSFVDPVFQRWIDPECTPLTLANPISADLSVMRTSLWPGLITALVYNQKRQQSAVRLFEQGLTFVATADGLQQESYLAGVVSGAIWPEQWGMSTRAVDFFDLKADVTALFALTGDTAAFAFTADQHPALHPGQSARITREGTPIGWMGALHPRVARALDVEGDAFVFALAMKGLQTARIPTFGEISKFPASRRDLALIVDESVSADAVRACICDHGGAQLRAVRLFDVYRGVGVPVGQKSLAFGLVFQDTAQSLTDLMIEAYLAEILTALSAQCGATRRV